MNSAIKTSAFALFALVVLSGCTGVATGQPAGQSAAVPAPKVSVPAPPDGQPAQAPQPAPANENPAPPAPVEAAPVVPEQQLPMRVQPKLSEQKAQGIALSHAKVASGKTPVYCNIDYEDDLPRANPEWDCEFVVSELEYTYEIDAVTGEIVNFERESVWD